MKKILLAAVLLGLSCLGRAEVAKGDEAGLPLPETGQNAPEAGQEIRAILSRIEENNPTLRSLRSQMEAQSLQNKAEAALPDPEIEFGYLFGSPADGGNRRDFSVTQTIDLSTIAGTKRRTVQASDELLALDYRVQKNAVLLEAQQICIELIFYNALLEQIGARADYAETLSRSYEKMLSDGQASRLDVSKARLGAQSILAEKQTAEIERSSLLLRLGALCGDERVTLVQCSFPEESLPESFEAWFEEAGAQSPVLAYVRQEVLLSEQKLKLSKMSALPSITAGYMSEVVPGSSFRGMTVGLSIPLWSAGRQIGQARAAGAAAKAREESTKTLFYNRLRALYERCSGLKGVAEGYREALEAGSGELLQKALETGEIGLLEFIMERQLYFDGARGALEAERDYALALAELHSVVY